MIIRFGKRKDRKIVSMNKREEYWTNLPDNNPCPNKDKLGQTELYRWN